MLRKSQKGDVQYKTLAQDECQARPSEEQPSQARGKKRSVLRSFFARRSALWALFLVTLMYSNNQLNRFILSSVANKLEQNANFGNGNGDSFEYGLLSGPLTTLPYCLGSAVIGSVADRVNKVYLLTALSLWWVLFSAMLAFANSFAEVAVYRVLAVLASSSCVTVGSGFVADNFPQLSRGTAMGVFGWGVPIGQGLVFLVGGALTDLYDYKVALISAAVWGVPVSILFFLTVKQPKLAEDGSFFEEGDADGDASHSNANGELENGDQVKQYLLEDVAEETPFKDEGDASTSDTSSSSGSCDGEDEDKQTAHDTNAQQAIAIPSPKERELDDVASAETPAHRSNSQSLRQTLTNGGGRFSTSLTHPSTNGHERRYPSIAMTPTSPRSRSPAPSESHGSGAPMSSPNLKPSVNGSLHVPANGLAENGTQSHAKLSNGQSSKSSVSLQSGHRVSLNSDRVVTFKPHDSIESARRKILEEEGARGSPIVKETIWDVFKDPTMICLFVASSFRQAGTLNWVYYRVQFFEIVHGMTKTEISVWMTWIPIVGGVSGAVFFGWVADRLSARGEGASGRLKVLAILHCLQVPTIFGIMYIKPDAVFVFALLEEFFERFFTPGSTAAIAHICPPHLRVSAISMFFVINTITGGNATLLNSSIGDAFDNGGIAENTKLRYSLYVLYLGTMAMAAVFYSLAWFLHKRRKHMLEQYKALDEDPQWFEEITRKDSIASTSSTHSAYGKADMGESEFMEEDFLEKDDDKTFGSTIATTTDQELLSTQL